MARVLVGMSGGVDSSVAALLLKEKGYTVIGVTMVMHDFSDTDKACASSTAIVDAKAVCDKLGIEHHVVDFKDTFKSKVIDYFANEYIKGRTPNPCNACNRYVKFEALIDFAINKFNCDFIATGHYAKVDFDKESNRYFLRKSITDKKDQTYALYNLTQEQLSRTLMPLGEYSKEEIREIALKNELVNAKKSDSQEICFIPDNDYVGFICRNYDYLPTSGNFVDIDGNILGRHKGIINYTIGQRKGLDIAFGKRVYVVDIDVNKNEVVLGDNEDLFKKEFVCTDVNWMLVNDSKSSLYADVKIRYSAKPQKALITKLDSGDVKVVFDNPERAITRGQAAVFYDNDVVIGGGTII